MSMRKRLEQMLELTPGPGEGFNVVGLDTYEDAGEELYLIEHFGAKAAAEAKAEDFRKAHPDAKVFVYGESGLTKSQPSEPLRRRLEWK